MKLPDTLSRKAITEAFTKLEPVTWEKLFEREDSNGIVKLRVVGDYQRTAYYRTEGIMAWLVTEGHYTLDDYRNTSRLGGEAPGPSFLAPRRIALSA